MVRLFKLLAAYLDQMVQRRYETSTIFSRLVFETVVTARYFVANFSPDLIDDYVRHSLRHERRLWDTVNASILKRGGTSLPIEQRMLNSIHRAERMADVSLQSVDLKGRTPWGGKNMREKADAVGLGGAGREGGSAAWRERDYRTGAEQVTAIQSQ